MTAKKRNRTWVENHAWDIGARKCGLALHCFTVGEVIEALGFSRNTVKKYVADMIEDGFIREIVMAKSIIIYRFTKEYVAYRSDLERMALEGVVKS